MAATLQILDEVAGGERRPVMQLHLATETVTVREIIESRVRQEVRNQGDTQPAFGSWLLEPAAKEQRLNRSRESLRSPSLDADTKVEIALEAFEANGFFLLVDERQVGSLDETICLTRDSEVCFIRLVPLVGG